SANHIQSSNTCDDCHSTNTWLGASFNHDNVSPGTCSSCHNGNTATGKPGNHFVTSLQCDECHNTTSFVGITFNHSSGSYPGDHGVNLSCIDCHTNNNQALSWPTPTYAPDCAGCHASDFRQDKHEKDTLSEVRDCAGSCHEKSSFHRVTDRDWDR
ncbi:MAG: hypothetical protein KBT54_09605, partial [Amphritea sp.]|nr:hypothetical protein [Amphritea sp.]